MTRVLKAMRARVRTAQPEHRPRTPRTSWPTRARLTGAVLTVFAIGAGCGWLGGASTIAPPEAAVSAELPAHDPLAWTAATEPVVAPENGPAARADRRGHPSAGVGTDAMPTPAAKPAAANPAQGFHHPQAVPVQVPPGTPKLAIVMDDLGLSRARTMRAVDLPPAVTLSFLSYAEGLPPLTAAAREAGHEVLAHVPMQPHDGTWDAGKNVLNSGLSTAERMRRLDWALARVNGKIGVNNHMGSAFTEDRAAMRTVLATLKARGLMFLDSRTTPNSTGEAVASAIGAAFAERDVFLDNTKDPDAIRESLNRTVAIARETGSAVAIGHPYPETFDVLETWLPNAEARGVAVVPLSAVTRPAHDAGAQTAARDGVE